jgi:small subunit ribosomal protein S6e
MFNNTSILISPKIQRLVTPLRLQRRRHLRSLKRRRLEHQKEQKTEFELVVASSLVKLPNP